MGKVSTIKTGTGTKAAAAPKIVRATAGATKAKSTKVPAASVKLATGPATAPSAAEIAQRAYLIFENEGRPHGRDVEHWLRAEAELTARV